VELYLVSLNQTDAYVQAYACKPRSASVMASKLMAKPMIAAAIAKAKGERSERVKKTADDVVRELERLALFDPADLTQVKRPEHINGLSEDIRRAIVGWSWDRNGNFTVKMAKESALEMLARHHGVFEKDNNQLGAGFAERLVKARERAAKA
jgi:phage terminase small subunit